MGQCANAGDGNNQQQMNNAVTTSPSGYEDEQKNLVNPTPLHYRSTLQKGSKLRTAHLLASEPDPPTSVSDVMNTLLGGSGSPGTQWVGKATKGTFERNFQTYAVRRNPITNPSYVDPYDANTTIPTQYTAAVRVNYVSVGTVDSQSAVIDNANGYFIFDYSNTSDVMVYYSLSNVHGVTILWFGPLTGKTGDYTATLQAYSDSKVTAAGADQNESLSIIQVPHLTANNQHYTYQNAWKLTITFRSDDFTFVRENVPHPATIQFAKQSFSPAKEFRPSYPGVTYPASVLSIIEMLAGRYLTGGLSKSWTGKADSGKFTRYMTVAPLSRYIFENPKYEQQPAPQYLTGCRLNYYSSLTDGGEVIDEASGLWLFDISDSNSIAVYYQLANFHGVNILYQGGTLTDAGDNVYTCSLTASVPTGLIQTPHLQPKNNPTNKKNLPPSGYTGNTGPWTLDVIFNVGKNSFEYVRGNNPHPAAIVFTPQ